MFYKIQASDQTTGVKAMFVVPKKRFKEAVDRNKLKRRMKESYRILKGEFYAKYAENSRIELGFVYYGAQKESFETINKAIKKLLTSTLK